MGAKKEEIEGVGEGGGSGGRRREKRREREMRKRKRREEKWGNAEGNRGDESKREGLKIKGLALGGGEGSGRGKGTSEEGAGGGGEARAPLVVTVFISVSHLVVKRPAFYPGGRTDNFIKRWVDARKSYGWMGGLRQWI